LSAKGTRHPARLGIAAILAVSLILAFSLRVVGVGVRDSSILKLAPTVLEPGLHFAPRGLFQIHRYAAGRSARPFGKPEPLSFDSPEGATMVARGEVEISLQPEAVLRLHAAASGDQDGWLRGHLEDVIYALLASPEFVPFTGERLPDMESEGARLLEEALAAAGVQVARFRLETIGYEGGPLLTAGPRTDVRRKVLWIAVDSFDWDIIEPLMEEGRMPNIARLREKGAWGRLQAVPPLLSPVLWTTIATGKRPEKHGILDFIATDPSSGAVIPVTSTLRKTQAYWNILSDSGISVGVVAWWASFPAEPVNGFMATDRIAYQLFKEKIRDAPEDNPLKAHPRDLWDEIAPKVKAPSGIETSDLSRFIDVRRHAPSFSREDAGQVNDFRTVLAATDTYTGIGMDLFRERPTDLRVIYFEAPDTASHLFMPFVPPGAEGVDPRRVEWFGNVVPEIYEYQDEWIGRLVEEFADEETTIIICSDHGFRTGKERPDTDSRIGGGNAAQWHAKDGVILLAGKDIRTGVRVLGASILDLVPTLLALYGLPVGEDMDGKVLEAALSGEFLAAHPLRFIDTYDTGASPREVQIAGISEEDQDLLEKLTSLGYIEQDAPTARINEGTILLQAGEYDEAVVALEAALEGGDRDPVRLSLARAYRLAGRRDEARRELRRLRAKGWNESAVLVEMAAISRAEEDWRAAERLLAEAAEADPESPRPHLHFARLYEEQERWEEALASYRKTVEMDPEMAEAWNQIGVIQQKLERPQEAMAALTRAIEANPDLPASYNNLGLLYRTTGRADKARQVIETGLTMAPHSAILHNSLGSLQYEAGEIDAAIRSFQKALDADPEYSEALSNLAVVYEGMRDAKKTSEYLNRLIELEPDNSDARVSLALVLMVQKRSTEATEILEGLLRREPGNFKGLVTLGKIHIQRGKHRQAASLLERAGRIRDDIPQLWNDLAFAYEQTGRGEQARQALRRSITLNPEQPEVARRLTEMGG
jgi:tetratricopeptide (TPR) repeat protein/predicted AlkP superfamily phosphohydrolase/phosphomutase